MNQDIYYEQIKKKRNEIYQERQNFQIQKESWEKSFSEHKARLEKTIEFFKKYNQIHEQKMIKSKEEEKMNQIKENYKNKDIKMQIDNLKSIYEIKLTKFTEKKKILEEEKDKFEKYKSDTNNNLDIKKIEIEKNHLDLLKLNSEINKRNNDIRTKEMYLKDKYEDYLRIKNIVETKEKTNAQYESDLKLTAERIVKYMNEIDEKEILVEKQKAELLKQSNEVKERQKKIEEDKMNIEHEKAELNLRYKYLNTFSYKSPNMLINNLDNNLLINNFENNNNNNTSNLGDNRQFNYTSNINNNIDMGKYNNTFNANRYIKAFKDRIENGNRIYNNNYKINENKLDIAKERLYIKKCNDAFKKAKYE
jgi:hypothetical protein